MFFYLCKCDMCGCRQGQVLVAEHLPLPLFSPGQQFFANLWQMQFQWDTQLLKIKLTKL